jgi:hypothetical protein
VTLSRAGALALAEHEVAYRTGLLAALAGLTPLNGAARRDLLERQAMLQAERTRALGDVQRLRGWRVAEALREAPGAGHSLPR